MCLEVLLRSLFLLAGAAGMALAAPVIAAAEQGNGRGGGGEQRGGGRGNDERGRGNDRAGRGGDDRGREVRQARREQRAERRERGQVERGRDRQERRVGRAERREERRFEREERRAERGVQRGPAHDRRERLAEGRGRGERQGERITDARRVARLVRDRGVSGMRGCPPGLARRDNGCLPPGLARRQLAQQQGWYDDWWSYPRQDADYFYDEGYLYQLDQGGAVAGYIPLLAGALSPGQSWPSGFEGYDVPDYHVDYFGLAEPYDYRLADGAIFGVDPASQAIRQVVALVTGDDWSLGQRMPDGYDVYNVPYQYRDQYADTQDSWYRYSDGYVYQVDPTTQLIQAAIQLIA